MNLLNYTLKYLAISMLAMITVWAVIFYVNMLDEVYDSLDDGLENYKLLVIDKVMKDSATLGRTEFGEGNYEIRAVGKQQAMKVKDVYQDTLMYMLNEKDMEPVRMLTTAFTHDGRFYELKVISSMVEEDDLIEDLFYSLVWLYLALLAGVLIINNFLLKKVWKPFYSLLDRLKTFRLGKDQKLVTEPTNVKEFKQLNEAVAGLVKHTLETYESQKHFIENASHELQTPVAISINKLELLSENNDLPEAGLETISQVIQTLERLKRLNKSLLLLSKIENKQFNEAEKISINEVLKNMTEEFADFAEYKDIAVSVHEKGSLNALMQKDLAEILTSNLLKNAIVHNHSQGTVAIEIQERFFVISNSGNLAALNEEKIFKRFHKDSTDNSNTGLGLAIVKAIVDLYGLKTRYFYDGKHNIRIDFPNTSF